MEQPEEFEGQKKVRKAELIAPPNRLKEKVGSGGIDESVLGKAQDMLENNNVDFKPIALMLVDALHESITDAKLGTIKGEEAIESMLYPAMQLKAQGGMFHYPLISEIANILVNFLETVTDTDKDVLDIVVAHKQSVNAVLASEIKGVAQFAADLAAVACARYYKIRKN